MPDPELGDNQPTGTLSEEEVETWFDDEAQEESSSAVIPAPISEDSIEQKYADGQLRIVRSSHDFTLHFLRDSLKDSNYINISPGYQRRDRWDRTRRSLLIESFLMNIPVPPIFLYENQYNQYEVMDGRQRLETIRDFLDNKFPLSGLEFWTELRGRRFSDLGPTLQKGLLRRSISAIVLLAETSRPDQSSVDVRMVLFRRLNTGGARLNPQELRNALYPGLFNDMIADLARDPTFTTVWRIPPKTQGEKIQPPAALLKNPLFKTMADCELVLRFFAIHETISLNLRGSLSKLLDQCMKRHQDDTSQDIDRRKTLFRYSLKSLHDVFGESTFTLPSTERLSRPLYDALMVATSLRQGAELSPHKDAIKDRLNDALRNEESYDILIGRGNTVDAIKARVRKAEGILFGHGDS